MPQDECRLRIFAFAPQQVKQVAARDEPWFPTPGMSPREVHRRLRQAAAHHADRSVASEPDRRRAA